MAGISARQTARGHGRRKEAALTRNDQIALKLIQHLGVAGAEETCEKNRWDSVLRAVRKQKEHALAAEKARRLH
ncbi:MAG: hypothetical protein RIC93_09205 [Alphaproteobacteria bacterium]|jgi:hypothetical protein